MLHFGLKLFKKICSFTTLKEENFAERKFKLIKFPRNLKESWIREIKLFLN